MKNSKGFTVLELLVVIAIIVMLAGLTLTTLSVARERAHEISCLSNLKNISYATEMYHREYDQYPKDNISTTLAPYVGDPLCFYCPSSGQSYDKFYVFRDSKVTVDKYVIGCPYHSAQSRGVIGFPYGAIETRKLAKVTLDGEPINLGDEFAGGQLKFEDGSRIVLTGDAVGFVVASFKDNDNRLYTIVRVLRKHGASALNVRVTDGSKFEIITPAAIAGVQGTRFKLYTQPLPGEYKTKVEVTEGVVEMRGRSGQVYTLGVGDGQTIEEDDAKCPEDPEEE